MTTEALLTKITSPRGTMWVISLMMLCQALLHAPFFNKPPMGQHVWRQTVGYAMARNYHQEDSTFWYPRNDIRPYPDNDGKIWHEFPLVYWLIGKSYGINGVQPINARLIWFIFCVCCIPITYFFALQLWSDPLRALLFSYCFSFVPYFFYYSITLAPNLHGLMWFLLGFSLLIRAEKRNFSGWQYLAGLIFVALGTITKPTYLFFGLPVAALFIWSTVQKRSWMIPLRAILGGGLVALVNAAVLRHANKIYQSAPLEQQVHTPFGPAPAPDSWQEVLVNLNGAITNWFGEFFVGYAAMPLFITGLFWGTAALGKSTYRNRIIWGSWLVSFAAFACFFVTRFKEHSYYITSTLPLAAAVSSYGAWRLLNHPQKIYRQLGILCLTLMPVFMVGRTYKRWTVNPQVPVELLQRSNEFQKVLPPNERLLIVGDATPIVFLYYLERKGIAEGTTISAERLIDLRKRGNHWLVSYNPKADLSAVTPYLNQVAQIGDFSIFKIGSGNG